MTIEVQRDTKAGNARRAVPPIFTPEQRAAADADLLASGEPLLTLAALAQELGVGSGALKNAVWPIRTVRYLSTSNPTLYAAKDVRDAVAPHLDALRARWAAHLAEVAAADVRRAERAAAHAQHMAAKAKPKAPQSAPPQKPKAHTTPLPPAARHIKVRAPEVTTIRRQQRTP